MAWPAAPAASAPTPRRSEIDADLIANLSTVTCAEKYGGSQTTYSRHKRLHLKPQLQAIAAAVLPAVASPPAALAAAMVPTVAGLLGKFGDTIAKLERLVADAELDGGIAVRAVSLRELRTGLTDATKLIATLAPPPPEPIQTINHSAIASLFAEISEADRDVVLERLLP